MAARFSSISPPPTSTPTSRRAGPDLASRPTPSVTMAARFSSNLPPLTSPLRQVDSSSFDFPLPPFIPLDGPTQAIWRRLTAPTSPDVEVARFSSNSPTPVLVLVEVDHSNSSSLLSSRVTIQGCQVMVQDGRGDQIRPSFVKVEGSISNCPKGSDSLSQRPVASPGSVGRLQQRSTRLQQSMSVPYLGQRAPSQRASAVGNGSSRTGGHNEIEDSSSERSGRPAPPAVLRNTIDPNVYYANALATNAIPQRNGRMKHVKSALNNDLRKNIRTTLNKMMGLHKSEAITAAHYPSADEVEFFAQDPTFIRGPRRVTPVRLDIGRVGQGKMVITAWNNEVARMTYEKLCEAYASRKRPPPPFEIFLPMFQARTRTLRNGICRSRRTNGAVQVLSAREAALGRMSLEHIRRGQGFCMNLDIPGVKEHWELYTKLDADVVSPDQPHFPSEDESLYPYTERKGPYEVRVLLWRNPDEEAWFRIGAILQLASHYTYESQATRGHLPRIRIRTGRVIDRDTPAPVGLPRNFYDPAWLRTLERSGEHDEFLSQIAAPFDTTLPEALIRRAARYEHIRTRKDKPLAENDEAILASSLFAQIGPNRTRGGLP
ncbi:hypothetical protein FB107DRAFT_279808 [Schizophyllum commune]